MKHNYYYYYYYLANNIKKNPFIFGTCKLHDNFFVCYKKLVGGPVKDEDIEIDRCTLLDP